MLYGKDMMMYRAYEEIPTTMVDYLLFVADVEDIRELSLDDINGYIEGYDAYLDEMYNMWSWEKNQEVYYGTT